MKGYGFIYFLSNPSMPGLTKIGYTQKHPLARMAELTSATACPEPFQMLAFFDCPEPRLAEKEIHERLENYRVHEKREFFHAPMLILQDVARQWGDPSSCFSLDTLDKLVEDIENGAR
jgi:hypothetical protein